MLKRFDDLIKRISGLNARHEMLLAHPIQDAPHIGAMSRRIAPARASPQKTPDDLRAPEQKQIERNFRNLASCKSDDEKPALPR